MDKLRRELRALDGRPYKAYKSLAGRYAFADFELLVDHVQGDPFALPSRITVRLSLERTAYPPDLLDGPVRRRAAEDFLGRALAGAMTRLVRGHRGSGKSGVIAIAPMGQQVLRRSSVVLEPAHVQARITLGLPAAGRRILGAEAEAMFFEELPAVVASALLYANLNAGAFAAHVGSVVDQAWLREHLAEQGLVAFLAEGSVLPRASGVDDRPLGADPLPLRAPENLARTLSLPGGQSLRGLGIPEGVTLIVGGGFHGKSTLLHALERGIYDHVPGDGRERVVTEGSAVKIRAEDGRAVSRVNISPFIDNLPLGRDTRAFTSENASGSTSQAAAIVEAVQAGARVLLIDEDTSATNFMIRDARMQALVADRKEPITPLLHRVRELHREHGVSSVIVVGGAGDYFAAADTVIMMDTYVPLDVTGRARALADPGALPAPGSLAPMRFEDRRRPQAEDLDPGDGRREWKIEARETRELVYGRQRVDLGRVEQLVDPAQVRAIGWLVRRYAARQGQGAPGLVEDLRRLLREAEEQGLDVLAPYRTGDLALPRLHEAAAAVNRMRGLRWR